MSAQIMPGRVRRRPAPTEPATTIDRLHPCQSRKGLRYGGICLAI